MPADWGRHGPALRTRRSGGRPAVQQRHGAEVHLGRVRTVAGMRGMSHRCFIRSRISGRSRAILDTR